MTVTMKRQLKEKETYLLKRKVPREFVEIKYD